MFLFTFINIIWNSDGTYIFMYKPGGAAVSAPLLVAAARLADTRAMSLHALLATALAELEAAVLAERASRLNMLRKRILKDTTLTLREGEAELTAAAAAVAVASSGGINRDDPILMWDNLHQAAALREPVS
jgi:hypothetical protein